MEYDFCWNRSQAFRSFRLYSASKGAEGAGVRLGLGEGVTVTLGEGVTVMVSLGVILGCGVALTPLAVPEAEELLPVPLPEVDAVVLLYV